jgi:hypothetical protein
MQYTSHRRGLLLSGKIVTGLGIGAAMAAATSYASEVCTSLELFPVYAV